MGIAVGFRQGLGLYLPFVSEGLGGRETFALAMGLMNLFWGWARRRPAPSPTASGPVGSPRSAV